MFWLGHVLVLFPFYRHFKLWIYAMSYDFFNCSAYILMNGAQGEKIVLDFRGFDLIWVERHKTHKAWETVSIFLLSQVFIT